MSLPDYLDNQMWILSVGLNPSIPSVELGYYFANPRNRFWKAFKQANIVQDDLEINHSVHGLLLKKYAIGFTDVVKRASRMGHDLCAEDFKRDAPMLREKIEMYQPEIIWFHGKVAMSKYMQYAHALKQSWHWGLNEIGCLQGKVYVTPNPSPANAAHSLKDLVHWYQAVTDL